MDHLHHIMQNILLVPVNPHNKNVSTKYRNNFHYLKPMYKIRCCITFLEFNISFQANLNLLNDLKINHFGAYTMCLNLSLSAGCIDKKKKDIEGPFQVYKPENDILFLIVIGLISFFIKIAQSSRFLLNNTLRSRFLVSLLLL